jgi:hypothetical protein
MSFYTKGNKILDTKGEILHLKGVSRTGLEYSYVDLNAMIPETIEFDIVLMKKWGFNAIRFPLRDRFWLNDMAYQEKIKYWVEQTLSHDMWVILDLHTQQDHPGLDPFLYRSTTGVDGLSMWIDIAKTYHNQSKIFFELFNEPHEISPNVWWNGDDTYYGYKEILTEVRKYATNICLLGGLDYAYQFNFLLHNKTLLAEIRSFPNLVLSVHPYGYKGIPVDNGTQTQPIPTTIIPPEKLENYTGDCHLGLSVPLVPPAQYGWEESFGFVVHQNLFPVIATEWGLDKPDNCIQGGWYNMEIVQYLNTNNISYMAWAWVQDRLDYPSLLETDFHPTGRGNRDTIGPACSGKLNNYYSGPGVLVMSDLQPLSNRILWTSTTNHVSECSFLEYHLVSLFLILFAFFNFIFFFHIPIKKQRAKEEEIHRVVSTPRFHSSIRIRSSHSLLQLK